MLLTLGKVNFKATNMRKLFASTIVIVLLVSLTLLPLVNADWSMFHSNPTHDGIGVGNPVYTLTQLWNYTTGDNVNSSPAVVNGVVYVASYDDNIYALNATTDSETAGFCNITIPQNLTWGDFSVYLDEMLLVEDSDYTRAFNGTHNLFHVTYTHGSHLIEIIGTESVPEFPLIIISSLLFAAFFLVIMTKTVRQKKSC